MKIAVDAMGGDFAPKITVLGSMEAIQRYKDIEIVLFGDEEKIKPYLTNNERISIVHTDKYLDMGEKDPVRAVRSGVDYSMLLAMKACKNGECDAMVSAGPTQVVIVGAHLIVKRMKQMQRVALAPIVPSLDGKGKIILDCGANVELKPEHIDQIAFFASVMAKCVFGYENPKVALINIGSEPGKGREVDKETFEVLKNDERLNFVGNIEPKEMFYSDCPIFVNDGFTGNILVKSIEGASKMFGDALKQEIKKSFWAKITYPFYKKSLKKFKKRFDTSEVGGAMVCGVNVPIVKAHGNSDAYAFSNAIKQVRSMVEQDVIKKVMEGFENE